MSSSHRRPNASLCAPPALRFRIPQIRADIRTSHTHARTHTLTHPYDHTHPHSLAELCFRGARSPAPSPINLRAPIIGFLRRRPIGIVIIIIIAIIIFVNRQLICRSIFCGAEESERDRARERVGGRGGARDERTRLIRCLAHSRPSLATISAAPSAVFFLRSAGPVVRDMSPLPTQ